MSRNTAEHQRRLNNLLRLPENRECCDCSAKQPSWASTNLGVFFCLRCAGLHRALGTHVSKVKSTTMDTWEEDMIRRCESVGNARGRLLYEHGLPAHLRPNPSSHNAMVERFIREKYERKLYYHTQYEELLKKFESEGGSAAASDSTTTGAEASAPVPTSGSSVPMLWGGTCTTAANSTPASNKDNRSGINMDDLFAPANTRSNPYSPQQPQLQSAPQVLWSHGAAGNVMGSQQHPPSYASPQATHQTGPLDAKAEIMSLFSSPSTHCSNHVYSAWQPQQSSPGSYLLQ